jgi:hypothetical protein
LNLSTILDESSVYSKFLKKTIFFNFLETTKIILKELKEKDEM